MDEQKLFFLSNGYDLLEAYTQKLYGDRGTFRHNLERYLNSNEFRRACRKPTGIDDIPEISHDAIWKQIEADQHFNGLAAHVVSTFDAFSEKGAMANEEYWNCAGVLGLCPGLGDDDDVLFPHLVDLSQSTEEEDQALIDSVMQKPNIVAVMVDTMLSGIRDHHIINVDGHNMCSKGYARFFYRGENAYHGQSRPSLFRKLPDDPVEKDLYMVLGEVRIIDFSLWLNNLSFVKKWPFGDVFHGAIAQHYGIPTNCVDVSTDLRTALFFACCRYEDGHWRPLKPDEFAAANSRNLGEHGDARYGIIYSAPVDVANMSYTANIPGMRLTYATPIGYQPFMRCASQSGYLVQAAQSYDMFKDASFQKMRFRLTENICNRIFEEMQGGALVYPNESFGTCDDVVSTIRESKQYTKKALQIALNRLGIDDSSGAIQKTLESRGYDFVPTIEWCSAERMQELEDNWAKHISENPQIQQPPTFQFGFCI